MQRGFLDGYIPTVPYWSKFKVTLVSKGITHSSQIWSSFQSTSFRLNSLSSVSFAIFLSIFVPVLKGLCKWNCTLCPTIYLWKKPSSNNLKKKKSMKNNFLMAQCFSSHRNMYGLAKWVFLINSNQCHKICQCSIIFSLAENFGHLKSLLRWENIHNI